MTTPLDPIPNLTLAGSSAPYVGYDFPPTIPGAERSYTMDFVNEIAILVGSTATVGGTVTAGDIVGIQVTNTSLSEGDVTISYLVQTGDSASTIAAALNAGINGTQALTDLQITSSVSGAVITILAPPLPGTQMSASLAPVSGSQFATETIEFAPAAFAGETIVSAACAVVSFEGAIDAAASSRVLSAATIAGSKVSFLIGQMLAGTNYRVTFTAVTAQQPAISLYSHLACDLPV